MSKTQYYAVTKTISKVDNSQGIIFDAVLMGSGAVEDR